MISKESKICMHCTNQITIRLNSKTTIYVFCLLANQFTNLNNENVFKKVIVHKRISATIILINYLAKMP